MAEPLHGHGPCQPVPETYFEFIASAWVAKFYTSAGFQSKIEEENMTQLGWYHLCKNDYFSFFFFLGDSPLSYFWILCWPLSKSLLLLREYLKKYYKIKVPENDDVNL